MQKLNAHSICLLAMAFYSIIYIGCVSKAYPDEAFVINEKIRKVFLAFTNNDTLIFQNRKGQTGEFVVTKIDSSINNKKGNFINARAAKSIYVSYKEFPIDKWSQSRIEMGANNNERKEIHEDAKLITITKLPDNNTTEIHISFKTFRCFLQDTLGTLMKDTIKTNNFRFTNYYKFYTNTDSVQKDSSEVKIIYLTNENGIIGYQERSGMLWTRMLK